jgi:hypothetical protein
MSYIKTKRRHTPEGEVGKNYWVCPLCLYACFNYPKPILQQAANGKGVFYLPVNIPPENRASEDTAFPARTQGVFRRALIRESPPVKNPDLARF